MKKLLFTLFVIAFTLIIIVTLSGFFNPSGAPAGYTGSPSDGLNCSNCHGGSTTQAQDIISSDIPIDGYIP
ncbi:MAG: hypothetical protein KA792_02060 [Bacteroidales bacterium]|nr:hypothetical protein [Bacteroidales bacterium]